MNYRSFSLLLFLSFGCSRISVDYPKDSPIGGASTHSVTFSSVDNYARNRSSFATKSDLSYDIEITPILFQGRDTVMYVVNYFDGWEIVSGDTRTPAILAYSEIGAGGRNGMMTHTQMMGGIR